MRAIEGFLILVTVLAWSMAVTAKADSATYIQGPTLIESSSTITANGGSTELTNLSNTNLTFTGSDTQTVTLPDATTLKVGRRFNILNRSTGAITVNDYGANLVLAIPAGSQSSFLLRAKASSAGTWDSIPILQPAGDYITALTGDVTASGPGSAAATVAGIQNIPVDVTGIANGNALIYNSGTEQFEPGTVAATSGGGTFTNFLTNGNLEAGDTTGWTASAGTLAAVDKNVTPANVYAGGFSGSWTPNAANDTLINTAHVITSGGGPTGFGAGFCMIKTAGTSHVMKVLDGTNVLNFYTIPAGTWLPVPVNASFPSSSASGINVQIVAGSNDAIYFDECFLGDAKAINAATALFATDWQLFTMVVTSTGTSPTKGTTAVDKAYWRRVGDTMEIKYHLNMTGAGSVGTGQYLFALPVGYSVDTNKQPVASTQQDFSGVGQIRTYDTAGSGYEADGIMYVYDSTHLAARVRYSPVTAGATITTAQVGDTAFSFGSPMEYYFSAKVPISGWTTTGAGVTPDLTSAYAAIKVPASAGVSAITNTTTGSFTKASGTGFGAAKVFYGKAIATATADDVGFKFNGTLPAGDYYLLGNIHTQASPTSGSYNARCTLAISYDGGTTKLPGTTLYAPAAAAGIGTSHFYVPIKITNASSSPEFIIYSEPSGTNSQCWFGAIQGYNADLTLGLYSATQTTSQVITGKPPTITKYTTGGASGTYTTPAGVSYLKVKMVGGGGGGGGAYSGGPFAGTGGGAGGCIETIIGSPAATYSYAVGNGGSGGGGGGSPANGNAGGDSTFGTNTAGGGGAGGSGTNGQGGAGGTATLNLGVGFAVAGGGGAGVGNHTTYVAGGVGGNSCLGGGGGSSNGTNSTGYAGAANTGGGGAGGAENSGTGGAGGTGVIVIEEHYN